jgi:hypothetical protein
LGAPDRLRSIGVPLGFPGSGKWPGPARFLRNVTDKLTAAQRAARRKALGRIRARNKRLDSAQAGCPVLVLWSVSSCCAAIHSG